MFAKSSADSPLNSLMRSRSESKLRVIAGSSPKSFAASGSCATLVAILPGIAPASLLDHSGSASGHFSPRRVASIAVSIQPCHLPKLSIVAADNLQPLSKLESIQPLAAKTAALIGSGVSGWIKSLNSITDLLILNKPVSSLGATNASSSAIRPRCSTADATLENELITDIVTYNGLILVSFSKKSIFLLKYY